MCENLENPINHKSSDKGKEKRANPVKLERLDNVTVSKRDE